jgi:hypothetical protein
MQFFARLRAQACLTVYAELARLSCSVFSVVKLLVSAFAPLRLGMGWAPPCTDAILYRFIWITSNTDSCTG